MTFGLAKAVVEEHKPRAESGALEPPQYQQPDHRGEPRRSALSGLETEGFAVRGNVIKGVNGTPAIQARRAFSSPGIVSVATQTCAQLTSCYVVTAPRSAGSRTPARENPHRAKHPLRRRQGTWNLELGTWNLNPSSAGAEEELQEDGGFLGQKAPFHFAAVVQAWVPGDISERAAVAGLGVRAAVDDSGETSVDRRAGAHGAGLDGGVEGCPIQAPGSGSARGLPDGLDLGVVGWVGQEFPPIAAASDHPALPHDDRADRDFLLGEGDPGEGECFLHELLVVGGEGHRGRRLLHCGRVVDRVTG